MSCLPLHGMTSLRSGDLPFNSFGSEIRINLLLTRKSYQMNGFAIGITREPHCFWVGLRRVHFGVFEADLHAAELFENGCSGDALGPVAQMGIVPERVKARTVVQFIRLAKTGCIHWISMA